MASYNRLVGLAIGAVAAAVTFTFGHLDPMDNGVLLTTIKGIATCFILPGLLCSAILTNMHDPNLIVAALCNLLFYSLVGIIVTSIIRSYRKKKQMIGNTENV